MKLSEQVFIGWHRTGVHYTAKLIFFHDFPVKVLGAVQVCILYSNFYSN